MRKIVITILSVLAVATVQAQHGSSIEFNTTTYNYDTIAQYADGWCTFTFRNTGNEPLIITSTSASCGCTMPKFSKKPVLPGGTGKIEVRYNTSLLGAFNKTVVVKSNAANAPTSVLRIRGFVREKKSKRHTK